MIRNGPVLWLILLAVAAGAFALIAYRPTWRAGRLIRTENGGWGPFVVRPGDPSIEHLDASDDTLHASYTTGAERVAPFWRTVNHQLRSTSWFPILEHQGIRIYHRTGPALDSSGAPWERLVIHLEPRSRRVRFRHWRFSEFAMVYCVQQRFGDRPWPLRNVVADFGRDLRDQHGVALTPIPRDSPPVQSDEDLKNLLSTWLESSPPEDRHRERLAPQATWSIESGPDSEAATLIDRPVNVVEVWHDRGEAPVLHLVCKNPATGGEIERTIPIRSGSQTGIVCPWPWMIWRAVLQPRKTGGAGRGRHAHAHVRE